MNASPNHRTYKVISLLLKAAILILSFCFIFYKLNDPEILAKIDFGKALKSAQPLFLFLSFSLMFLNWGLESKKWKILIADLEEISFGKAFRSIFAGVTVSIFMPNRIGEFAGRIFFLEKASKIEATLKNFVGSVFQFGMTLFIGMLALFLALEMPQLKGQLPPYFHASVLFILFVSCVLIVVFFILLNRSRSKFSPKLQSYFSAVFDTGNKVLRTTAALSFLRYLVFLIQYYLVLKAFNVDQGLYTSFVIIALIFLITSAIPTFALTEVVTRGAVAASLFGFFTPDIALVVVASLVVWIINLAIPAMIGGAFIWKLKFFKA